jgi:hypothetical protein
MGTRSAYLKFCNTLSKHNDDARNDVIPFVMLMQQRSMNMLKMILLAGTMTIAAPVLAQTATQAAPTAQAAPATTQTAPTTAPATDPAAATAPQAAQPDTGTPAQTADATATAQPAADATQVASAVDTQFGTYDKNSDGKLSRAEFSEWMVALKTASDPSTKAESAATKKWVGAAFAQADTDKNKVLDKTEVTGFLQQGQS